MRQAVNLDEIARIRASIERVGGLSDNILKLGRFGIGLDGLLAWIPAVGTIYSLTAGGYLLVQGWRARLPASTLATGVLLLSARSLITALGESFPPFLPVELLVDVFRAHKLTADLLLKAIDRAHYVETADQAGGRSPDLGRTVVRLG